GSGINIKRLQISSAVTLSKNLESPLCASTLGHSAALVSSPSCSKSIRGADGHHDAAKRRGRGKRLARRGSLRGAGGGNRGFLARLARFVEALQYGEEGGDEEHRETGRGDDAAQYAEAQGDAAVRAGAGRQHQRHDPEPEREGGHQDRPEPRARGLDGG